MSAAKYGSSRQAFTVLIADDGLLERNMVKAIFQQQGHRVVLAADGMEALLAITSERPDVVVLDYMMPGMSGLEVVRSLHTRQPETRVVMLSLHDEEFYVLNTIMNGASGYILKEDVTAHLALAINAAAIGCFYFSPILQERIALSEPGNPADRLGFFEAVTRRIPNARVKDILPSLSAAMKQAHISPHWGGNHKSIQNN